MKHFFDAMVRTIAYNSINNWLGVLIKTKKTAKNKINPSGLDKEKVNGTKKWRQKTIGIQNLVPLWRQL